MNTTAPRVKAGGPPPLQLHRGVVTPIPSTYKGDPSKLTAYTATGGEGDGYAIQIGFAKPEQPALQIDFVLPDEPEPAADATKDLKASDFAFWFWSRAMWTACWFGLGVIYARNFY